MVNVNARTNHLYNESVHHVFLYDIQALANSATYFNNDKTVSFKDTYKVQLGLYGFLYCIRHALPLLSPEPVISISLSKDTVIQSLWDSTFDLQQDRIIYFDAYKSFPATDEVFLRKPILFEPSDSLYISFFLDNSTGASLTKMFRLHLTLFYYFI